ncbi:MAG: ABC transporter ATP-binding protein [Magnetococcales bacterium]|nr:ABC transporter ATP-binding protein [Magnetococcales bacterium]
MIDVSNLTRNYGAFKAVDNVSFNIGHGEVVGLLGHNGAGKTTIMKMLTGFLEPTSGTIKVDGLDIEQDKSAIQSRIGYLPENCPLWPEMTVIDYLDFQATMHGIADNKKTEAIRKAIKRTALGEKASQAIHTLSRGYRQRVGVAQAILHRPKIIILDEPTNGLDPTQIRQMRSLIKELAKEATVIISTHILQEVQAVCERVLILHSGKLAIDSHLEELQNDQKIRVTIDGDWEKLLRDIDGVELVTPAGKVNGKYSYILNAKLHMAPLIASTLIKSDIQLFALAQEKHDLETVFAKANEIGIKSGAKK